MSIDLDPMRRPREAFDAMIGFPHREPSQNPPPCTLSFHFAPWRGRPEMIDFHIRQLAQYLPQFNKLRMTIVTGPEFADPAKFIEPRIRAAARPGADVQFFPHSPRQRERRGEPAVLQTPIAQRRTGGACLLRTQQGGDGQPATAGRVLGRTDVSGRPGEA